MRLDSSYKKSLSAAVLLHVMLMIALIFEVRHNQYALTQTAEKNTMQAASHQSLKDTQAIKAVSVDSQAVMETVNQLKMAREREKAHEQKRQQALANQAERARQQRLEEQARLNQLKKETAILAKKRREQLIKDQKRLKELENAKRQEEKRLADLKKKQARAEALAREKREAREKALQEEKRQARLREAAQKKAQVAKEVDKYKALIIQAIGRQWILPDHVESGLYSQFRIRLAPNGVVLEVSLVQSSGDPILDRSAQSAIYKASPLPVPGDPDAFNVFRDIRLTVRPENIRG